MLEEKSSGFESVSLNIARIKKNSNKYYAYHRKGDCLQNRVKSVICLFAELSEISNLSGSNYISGPLGSPSLFCNMVLLSTLMEGVSSVAFLVIVHEQSTNFILLMYSSADSRRAVVGFWRKNVHNTG